MSRYGTYHFVLRWMEDGEEEKGGDVGVDEEKIGGKSDGNSKN